MAILNGRLLALLLAAAAPALHAKCAGNVEGLRQLAGERNLPLRWIETGMEDGKPLSLTMEDRAGALFLQFVKEREGLWAAGAVSVCLRGTGWVAVFEPGQVETGPATGWLLRQALRRGANVEFALPQAGELRVQTLGWRGRFAPAREEGSR